MTASLLYMLLDTLQYAYTHILPYASSPFGFLSYRSFVHSSAVYPNLYRVMQTLL